MNTLKGNLHPLGRVGDRYTKDFIE